MRLSSITGFCADEGLPEDCILFVRRFVKSGVLLRNTDTRPQISAQMTLYIDGPSACALGVWLSRREDYK